MMKPIHWGLLATIIFLPALVSGQNWSVPDFPTLASPTPLGSGLINPGGTPTPTPPSFDSIVDSVATLESAMLTPVATITNTEGTPIALEDAFDEFAGNASVVFGYSRSLTDTNVFGYSSRLVTFLFLLLTSILALRLLTFLMPLLAAIFGLVRKLIGFVLEFIPL